MNFVEGSNQLINFVEVDSGISKSEISSPDNQELVSPVMSFLNHDVVIELLNLLFLVVS